MQIRLTEHFIRQESSRRLSLNRKVRVRTSHLPQDFFQSVKGSSRTRPSSASRSFGEPQTPKFGKRDFSLIEEKGQRRNKRKEMLFFVRERSKRYDGSLEGREVKQKLRLQLPMIGKKHISWGA